MRTTTARTLTLALLALSAPLAHGNAPPDAGAAALDALREMLGGLPSEIVVDAGAGPLALPLEAAIPLVAPSLGSAPAAGDDAAEDVGIGVATGIGSCFGTRVSASR